MVNYLRDQERCWPVFRWFVLLVAVATCVAWYLLLKWAAEMEDLKLGGAPAWVFVWTVAVIKFTLGGILIGWAISHWRGDPKTVLLLKLMDAAGVTDNVQTSCSRPVGLERLREAVRRQPFQPFTMRLADRRSITVSRPEFIAVGNRRVIVVAEDDSWSVVEPDLIVSLDYDGHLGA